MSHRGGLSKKWGLVGNGGGGLSGEVSYRYGTAAVRLAHERTKVEWSMAEHTGAPCLVWVAARGPASFLETDAFGYVHRSPDCMRRTPSLSGHTHCPSRQWVS